MAEQSKVRLILARHGNTFNKGDKIIYVGAKTDLALTDKGHEQALDLGQSFLQQNIQPATIFCGSLQRQIQTAKGIAQILQFNETSIQTKTQALDEVDYGPWEGLTEAEILANWPEELENWTQGGIWPQGIFTGTLEHRQALLKTWCQYLIENYNNQTVIAVSSNGIIRLMISLIPELWQKTIQNKSFIDYKVKTGNYCELEITDASIEIKGWNISA